MFSLDMCFTRNPSYDSTKMWNYLITVGEFDHPNLSPDSPLRTHVLYQIDL